MQQKGILKHWILPQNDLLKGTRWHMMPLGNSPEFNPLDCNLNRDLHVRVQFEISLIITKQKCSLNLDESKFSSTKQSDLQKLYQNVWKIHPDTERVKEDIYKIPKHFKIVYENDGCVVKGIGQNKGIRYKRNIKIWNDKIQGRTNVCDKSNTCKTNNIKKTSTLKELTAYGQSCLEQIIQSSRIKIEGDIKGNHELSRKESNVVNDIENDDEVEDEINAVLL